MEEGKTCSRTRRYELDGFLLSNEYWIQPVPVALGTEDTVVNERLCAFSLEACSPITGDGRTPEDLQ